MKITFILPGFGRSGGIKVTVQAANGLLQKGHDVSLLVNYVKSLRPQFRNLWLSLRYSQGYDWIRLFEGKVNTFTTIKEYAFEDDEIVVAVGWWAARELRQLPQSRTVKIHYVHGVLKDTNLMKEAWGENLPKIVVASYLERMIEEISGQKITAVIPNGVDTNEYYPSVPEDHRDGVGTIFSNSYPKDPETTLKVLKKLREKCRKTPQRVFGAWPRPKGISYWIYNRLPSLEKARDIYSQSLVWTVCSRSEGFGIPVLEAMACGCAVVATDCGGTQDIIVDGENGFLVEVGNVDQIVDRVKLLLYDPKLRQQFVRKSQETIKKFPLDLIVNKLEKVLMDLAELQRRHGEDTDN